MKIVLSGNKNLATAVVCVVALVVAVVFTTGMTPTFDSARYANVAHWLAAGEGVATSLTVVPVQEGTAEVATGLHAFTIQPPGLPLLYALTGVENRAVSHRILHLISFVCLAWVVMALGRQITGRSEVGVAAALLSIFSPGLLQTAANFWTDLPTMALLLGALYCLIRGREFGPRSWVWLVGASILSALAVSLRLTALAFAAVLLVDIVMHRRLSWRAQLVRIAAGSGIFSAITLWIFLRNLALSGRFTGVAVPVTPLEVVFSLASGWAYLGSRLMQSLVPGWAFDAVDKALAVANAGPDIWRVPAILLFLLVALIAAVVVLRRKQRLSWPQRRGEPVAGAFALAMTFVVALLLLLLLPAARNPDFRVVEFRYVASVLPLLWIGLMCVVMGSGRRLVDLSVAAILVLAFAIGVPGRYQPYGHDHEYMRGGLNWVKENIGPETAVMTNGGKVLLDENLAQRVFHISDWNFSHVLGPDMRTEAGLLKYLQNNDIRYVVLFGTPDMHKATYWGRPIIGLFLEQGWRSWAAYRDRYVKVYRIPASGPPPGQN